MLSRIPVGSKQMTVEFLRDSSRIPIGILVEIRKELCNHLVLKLIILRRPDVIKNSCSKKVDDSGILRELFLSFNLEFP